MTICSQVLPDSAKLWEALILSGRLPKNTPATNPQYPCSPKSFYYETTNKQTRATPLDVTLANRYLLASYFARVANVRWPKSRLYTKWRATWLNIVISPLNRRRCPWWRCWRLADGEIYSRALSTLYIGHNLSSVLGLEQTHHLRYGQGIVAQLHVIFHPSSHLVFHFNTGQPST